MLVGPVVGVKIGNVGEDIDIGGKNKKRVRVLRLM